MPGASRPRVSTLAAIRKGLRVATSLGAAHLVWLLVLAWMLPAPSTASAQPIFDSAVADPPLFSPNGDGVNEFTQIRYTIAVDSADVRAVLEPADGGAPIDTLQGFTRQGAGVRVIVFDGTGRSGTIPDGAYRVQLLGVGSGGEGSETRTLDVTIDRAPPVFGTVQLIDPGNAVYVNGDTIRVEVCLPETPASLTVDFSALDSNYDAGSVVRVPGTDGCNRYEYVVSGDNDLVDAAGLDIVVRAMDAAGNTSTRSLPLCLSNHPPQVDNAMLIGNPIYQNGSRIALEVTFDSPNDLDVSADFSTLDSGFSPGNVEVMALGNQTFRIEYTITDINTRADGEYTIRVSAIDQGCGSVSDARLTATLDNSGLVASVLDNVKLSPEAFSPGLNTTTISYDVIEDSTLVSIFAEVLLEGSSTPTLLQVRSPRVENKGSRSFVWDGSFPGVPDSTVLDQDLTVTVRAISYVLGLTRSFVLPATLDRVPPRFISTTVAPNTPVGPGDPVSFRVTYDAPGYDLRFDFSALDTQFIPGERPVSVLDRGDGTYDVSYVVSSTNATAEGTGIDVPIGSSDVAGNQDRLTGAVTFCYTDTSPIFLMARLLGDPGPFGNGDTVRVETEFTGLGPFTVSADFSSVDSEFNPDNVEIIRTDDRTGTVFRYEIIYAISEGNDYSSRRNQPVLVTAMDSGDLGCGERTVEAILIDLDTEGPPTPRLDPLEDYVVDTPTIRVAGIAPGATYVETQLNEGVWVTVSFSAVPFPDSAFVADFPIEVGENLFRMFGVDDAGNRSLNATPPTTVYRAEGALIVVPSRFKPNDAFQVRLVEAASSVAVSIYDLDGVEIRRFDEPAGDRYEIVWDGTDHRGLLTNSGPYFAVITIQGSSGTSQTREPFVFTRR